MLKMFGRTTTGYERSQQPTAWLIHPLSVKRQLWEGLISVLILWSGVEVPFSVAFLLGARDDSGAAYAVEWLVDSILMADVVATFFVGYRSRSS